jgi:hypothetical protein
MPVVKFLPSLDLDPIRLFLDEHYLQFLPFTAWRMVIISIVTVDELVKNRIIDGVVKSSRSRLANPEEYRYRGFCRQRTYRTPRGEG